MQTPDFCKAVLKMLLSFLYHQGKAKRSGSVAGAQSQWPSKWRGLKSVSELLSALSCPIFSQLHNTWLLIFSAAYFIPIDLRWTMMNVFTATGLSWGRCDQDAYSTFVTFGVSLMQGDVMFSCSSVQFWWFIWGLIELIVCESLDYVVNILQMLTYRFNRCQHPLYIAGEKIPFLLGLMYQLPIELCLKYPSPLSFNRVWLVVNEGEPLAAVLM